ncbi:hypothetical protein MASR1M60_26430 [Rhodocyclaceae bacterium]
MAIDWGALLPTQPAAAPTPARATVQTHAPGTNAGGAGGNDAGEDGDREAWEERAAILEYEAGFDRATAEAMATAECTRSQHADKWAARAGDDRRLCPECGRYRDRRCTIAKPGGLVSASRNYEPVLDLPRRCEGFAPLPDDPDQRPGVERWPWLLLPPYRPASPATLAPKQPAQSPSGRASV